MSEKGGNFYNCSSAVYHKASGKSQPLTERRTCDIITTQSAPSRHERDLLGTDLYTTKISTSQHSSSAFTNAVDDHQNRKENHPLPVSATGTFVATTW